MTGSHEKAPCSDGALQRLFAKVLIRKVLIRQERAVR